MASRSRNRRRCHLFTLRRRCVRATVGANIKAMGYPRSQFLLASRCARRSGSAPTTLGPCPGPARNQRLDFRSGMFIAPRKWPPLNSPGLRTSITSAPCFRCSSAAFADLTASLHSRMQQSHRPGLEVVQRHDTHLTLGNQPIRISSPPDSCPTPAFRTSTSAE